MGPSDIPLRARLHESKLINLSPEKWDDTLEDELIELKSGEQVFMSIRPKLIKAGYTTLVSILRIQKGSGTRFYCPALKGVDGKTQGRVTRWIQLLHKNSHSIWSRICVFSVQSRVIWPVSSLKILIYPTRFSTMPNYSGLFLNTGSMFHRVFLRVDSRCCARFAQLLRQRIHLVFTFPFWCLYWSVWWCQPRHL